MGGGCYDGWKLPQRSQCKAPLCSTCFSTTSKRTAPSLSIFSGLSIGGTDFDRTKRFHAQSATSPARSSRSQHCRRKVTSSHSNAQVVGRGSTYQSTGNATFSEMKGTGQNAGFHERIGMRPRSCYSRKTHNQREPLADLTNFTGCRVKRCQQAKQAAPTAKSSKINLVRS